VSPLTRHTVFLREPWVRGSLTATGMAALRAGVPRCATPKLVQRGFSRFFGRGRCDIGTLICTHLH